MALDAKNRIDDFGTYRAGFVLQKGLELLIFNFAPTNPWTFELTDDPDTGPASVLIASGPIAYDPITNLNNVALFEIDVTNAVIVPGQRYRVRIKDNTTAVIDEGVFDIFEIDAGAAGGLSATINALVKQGLGMHGENARLVNDKVEFGIPTEQTLTLYTDNTLVTILDVVDIRRYLDETHRVIAEVSRLQ